MMWRTGWPFRPRGLLTHFTQTPTVKTESFTKAPTGPDSVPTLPMATVARRAAGGGAGDGPAGADRETPGAAGCAALAPAAATPVGVAGDGPATADRLATPGAPAEGRAAPPVQ